MSRPKRPKSPPHIDLFHNPDFELTTPVGELNIPGISTRTANQLAEASLRMFGTVTGATIAGSAAKEDKGFWILVGAGVGYGLTALALHHAARP